jgi:hypothetical protein
MHFRRRQPLRSPQRLNEAIYASIEVVAAGEVEFLARELVVLNTTVLSGSSRSNPGILPSFPRHAMTAVQRN